MITKTGSTQCEPAIPQSVRLDSLRSACDEPENILSRFAAETHGYVADLIRFADEKAAFFFGASAAVLYVLFSRNAEKGFARSLNAAPLHSLIGLLAMATLSMACVFGLSVVTPRRGIGPAPGHIFFDEIIRFNTRMSFADEVMRLTKDELISERLMHSYDLAKVCNRKYRAQMWQLWSMITGLTLAAFYLLF